MSKFQIILLVVFGFFILLAVAVFSTYRSGSGSDNAAVTIWGEISSRDFSQFLANSGLNNDENVSITYVEKSPETIDTEFTEALAQGIGPDLIIITQDKVLKEKPKIIPIPYESIGEKDFKKTFIEEAELLLAQEGIYGLPLSIDPFVLYYNRDLLSAAGMAQPMGDWDEIYAAATKLTKKDAALNITQSVMALGESRNIPHSKDILSLLMMQAGTAIVSLGVQGLNSELLNNYRLPVSPAESALEFYTQFSNPTKSFYSWNRSLLDAQTNFTSGASAYYLGYASELRVLKNKNPTLNLAVASVPQSRVSGKVLTFGKLSLVAIARGTKNSSAALAVATKLVSNTSAKALSDILEVPPARRDLLSEKSSDAIFSVFYEGAIQARAWLDPNNKETKNIFTEMIESVTSGRARVNEALREADKDLKAILE